MCVSYRLEQRYLLHIRDLDLLVGMKYFLVKKNSLYGYTQERFRYKLTHHPDQHWLYIPPSIKNQDVSYVYHRYTLSTDHKTIEWAWDVLEQMGITQLPHPEYFSSKLKLGYHAHAFDEEAKTFGAPEDAKRYFFAPVLFSRSELMCLDKVDVVVRAFRIPDPEHFPALYRTAFRLYGARDEDIELLFNNTSKTLKGVFENAPKNNNEEVSK